MSHLCFYVRMDADSSNLKLPAVVADIQVYATASYEFNDSVNKVPEMITKVPEMILVGLPARQ